MVGCGLACPGVGVQGCRGASSGGRGGGGTVGGLGPGGGVPGGPYHMGGGGGVATRNTGPYIYVYTHFSMYFRVPVQTRWPSDAKVRLGRLRESFGWPLLCSRLGMAAVYDGQGVGGPAPQAAEFWERCTTLGMPLFVGIYRRIIRISGFLRCRIF